MKAPEQEKTKRTFFSDIMRKIGAGAIAVMAWWAVSDNITHNYEVSDVKLNVITSDRRMLYQDHNQTVTITVKTSKPREQIHSEDFVVNVKIPPMELRGMAFQREVELKTKDVATSFLGPDVLAVKPSFITLDFDVITTKMVPVQVVESGSLPKGKSVVKAPKPEVVRLTGPSSTIRPISFIKTEDIQLSFDTKNSAERKKLVPPYPNADIYPGEVEVDVKVINDKDMSELKYGPLNVSVMMTEPQRFSWKKIDKLECTVTLRGPKFILDQYKENIPQPYVSISSARTPGRYQAVVHATEIPIHDQLEVDFSPRLLELELSELTPQKAQPEKQEAAKTEAVP